MVAEYMWKIIFTQCQVLKFKTFNTFLCTQDSIQITFLIRLLKKKKVDHELVYRSILESNVRPEKWPEEQKIQNIMAGKQKKQSHLIKVQNLNETYLVHNLLLLFNLFLLQLLVMYYSFSSELVFTSF